MSVSLGKLTPEDLISDASALQALLLQRTDALLADVCAVFDDAMDTVDATCDALAIETAMGAVAFATDSVLSQAPTVKYGLMFTRTQRLLNARDNVSALLGPDAADTISEFILPYWAVLRCMDAGMQPGGDAVFCPAPE